MAWGFGSHASGRPITSDEITWPTLISDYVDQQQSARLGHWPLPSQSQSAQGSPSSSGGIMVFNNSMAAALVSWWLWEPLRTSCENFRQP